MKTPLSFPLLVPLFALAAACGSPPEGALDEGSEASAASQDQAFRGTTTATPPPESRRFLVHLREGANPAKCASMKYAVQGVVRGIFLADSLFDDARPAKGVLCRFTWAGPLPVPQRAIDELGTHAAAFVKHDDGQNGQARAVFRQIDDRVDGDGSTTRATLVPNAVPRPSATGGAMGCSSCVSVYDGVIHVVLPPYVVDQTIYLLPSPSNPVGQVIETGGAQAFWLPIPAGTTGAQMVVDW